MRFIFSPNMYSIALIIFVGKKIVYFLHYLALWLKSIVHTNVGVFLFHWFILMSMQPAISYCGFIANLEIMKTKFILFQNWCGYFLYLHFHIHLIFRFSISSKCYWSFKIASYFIISLRRLVILTYRLAFNYSQQNKLFVLL